MDPNEVDTEGHSLDMTLGELLENAERITCVRIRDGAQTEALIIAVQGPDLPAFEALVKKVWLEAKQKANSPCN